MELWSDLHLKTLLPAFFVFASISIFLGIWLAKKDESIRLIPIKILSVILVLLEIAKQIYAIAIGYDLYNLPLHFCSIIVFLLPIFCFLQRKTLSPNKVHHIRLLSFGNPGDNCLSLHSVFKREYSLFLNRFLVCPRCHFSQSYHFDMYACYGSKLKFF